MNSSISTKKIAYYCGATFFDLIFIAGVTTLLIPQFRFIPSLYSIMLAVIRLIGLSIFWILFFQLQKKEKEENTLHVRHAQTSLNNNNEESGSTSVSPRDAQTTFEYHESLDQKGVRLRYKLSALFINIWWRYFFTM